MYLLAITCPYAPALRIAIRSPLSLNGSRRPAPHTSLDSQTGPTTSYTWSLSLPSCTSADRFSILWYAPYRAGLMRSFIPASRIRKVFVSPLLTKSTREMRVPHWATTDLPGSTCTDCPGLSGRFSAMVLNHVPKSATGLASGSS